MARSRNIKPGFFTNEELAELPFETRLLFIGLWTLADREGRLGDRPKRIKMALFPADIVDVDAMLDELCGGGLIQRYTVAGEKYIQVVNFTKHQSPHYKEPPSTIPPPGADSDDAPGRPETSPRQAPDEPGSSRSDSGFLIPDSGFLIADTGGSGPPTPQAVDLGVPSNTVPDDWEPNEIIERQARPAAGVDRDLELRNFRLHTFARPKSPAELDREWAKWLNNARPRASPKQPVPRGTPADQRRAQLHQNIRELCGDD